MIRGKAPLRISFAGGGTDLNYIFEKYGGAVVNTTIDKFCHMSIGSATNMTVNGSNVEGLSKQVLDYFKPKYNLKIDYYNDIPPGSGLGSSSSFIVLMLSLLYELEGVVKSDIEIVKEAYQIDNQLKEGGWQDQGHEVHYLANGYTGATISHVKLVDGTEFNYKIHGQRGHQYFGDIMSEHLKKTKTDIFFILLDTFMLHGDPQNPQNGWFLRTDTSPSKTFFWFPSDGGGGMPFGCDLILKKVDKPVAMAKFGQKQVKDYYNINTDYVPHGTEPERFYKLSDEDKLKLRHKWNLVDKFVVGQVARNQGRKMIDRTLKTFRLFKDKCPNAVLLFHSDPDDHARAFNLRKLISEYNLENSVRFTGMNASKGFNWNEMNEIYNLFDVFFLSTSGEGFGIPIIEAMSCQIPVIATSYTTTPELVELNMAGLGVELAGTEKLNLFEIDSKEYDKLSMNGTVTGGWEVERSYIDIKKGCDALLHLYNNPELRKKMGENGRKAVLEQYDFNKVVGPAFEKLFNES